MSEENVELVRQAFERWRRDGWTLNAIPAGFFAEDIEWDQSAYPLVDFPTKGVGRGNLLEAIGRYLSDWTEYAAEVTESIDGGENVFAVVHERANIGGSGQFIERDLFTVWTIRAGQAVRYRTFQTREQALEAAGLSD
jgi:ketosteroid isomerase-like protein